MVIRRSSAVEIETLVADLDGTADMRRDAAVARLAIIGRRAVERLCAAVPLLSPAGRLAALQALEAIGDPRCMDVAIACLADTDREIGAAASAVARVCLRTEPGTTVLDRLGGLVADRASPEAVRLLALDALAELPPSAIAPLLATLKDDPSEGLRARAARQRVPATRGSRPSGATTIEELVTGRLAADPERVRTLVAEQGREAPLPSLHRLIELIREKEAAARRAPERAAWATARAVIHQTLGERGSNVALYDLRETIERAEGPVAVEFLAALGAIGDESCLEPIVMAYARSAATSPSSRPDWWQTHLAETFRAIVRRTRLTGRHSVIRRIRSRWPGAAAELLERKRKRGTPSRPASSEP